MAVPEGSTDIRVATPLPSSVLMTLGRLIDLAWPGAELATGNRGEITFRVNRAAASDITADEAAGAKVELAEGDVAIQELGPEGVSLVTPAALAASLLPILKASFQENPDAANYLETTRHRPGRLQPVRADLRPLRAADPARAENDSREEAGHRKAGRPPHRTPTSYTSCWSRGPSRHLPGRRECSPGRHARAQSRQRGLGLAPPALRIDH
jgi:hypothetical protein